MHFIWSVFKHRLNLICMFSVLKTVNNPKINHSFSDLCFFNNSFLFKSLTYTVFPLINAAPLGIHIKISASRLTSAAPLTTTLIRIVIIFY